MLAVPSEALGAVRVPADPGTTQTKIPELLQGGQAMWPSRNQAVGDLGLGDHLWSRDAGAAGRERVLQGVALGKEEFLTTESRSALSRAFSALGLGSGPPCQGEPPSDLSF